jgi:hypothetical protein
VSELDPASMVSDPAGVKNLTPADPGRVKLNAYRWARGVNDWYVEPEWCSRRLFEVETFVGSVWDPACGMGRIVRQALAADLPTFGTDVAQRGTTLPFARYDFLGDHEPPEWVGSDNIVTNPPFDVAPQFAMRALDRATGKVAIIFPTARLNAAKWLRPLPLARVWLLTPRPSMPPGETILRGEKPGGGKMDFCWLVFEQGYPGSPSLRWLDRDQ